MNIFAIEGKGNQIDWIKSAQSLDNYRVVKMILESTQMLCTAINDQHGEKVTPYKNAHLNHPSTKWVRASSANFECLVEHTLAMLDEYTERFGKIHKCAGVLETVLDLYDPSLFPSSDTTPLPLCMPDEYKSDNIVESYRSFYSDKPRMRYPKSKVPSWFSEKRTKEFQLLLDK
jgi:hypothetical protein|tara:strand:- start:2587 stop:3108 length:522 start_codon:yes stop_codon:yes gene_type:complete